MMILELGMLPLNLVLSHHGHLLYLWLCLRRRPFYEYHSAYELTLVARNELSTGYVIHHKLWERGNAYCYQVQMTLVSPTFSHSVAIKGVLLVLDSKSVHVASSGIEWQWRSRFWGKVHFPTIMPVEYSLVVFLSTLVRACRLTHNYCPWVSIIKSSGMILDFNVLC